MADAAALKAQANTAFAAKDFATASELYSKAIELDPTNHVLFSNRSASKSSLKDYQGALEDAEKTIELDPKFVKGYARKGAALHGLSQYEDAVFAYEAGLQIDPNNAALKKGQADVQNAMDAAGPPGGDDGLGKMFNDPNMIGKLAANPKTAAYMRDPEFVKKVIAMQKGGGKDMGAMMGDPRMMTVLGVLMGIDLQAFERPEGSEEMPPGITKMGQTTDDDDEEMPSLDPLPTPSSSAPRKRATVEDDDVPAPSSSKAKPTPKAPEPEPMEVEETEDDLKKKEAAALKKEGTEAYKKKEFEVAAEKFGKAWEVWQGDVSYLTNLSAVYFEMAEYEKCIEACEKSVEEGRNLRADYKIIAKAIARAGAASEKLGNLTQAIKYYNKSLTEHRTPDVLEKLRIAEKTKKEADIQAYVDPELAEKAREEGNAFFKKAEFAEAVKSYTEAIKRLPTEPKSYNNRAAALTKLVALPEALKDAEKAIELDPKFVKAYIRKSLVLSGMREWSRALQACQAATEMDTEKKHTREIETQMSKCLYEQSAATAGETDEQTLERAMKDPEVAGIMSDPAMRSILSSAQDDPKVLQEHMKNPVIKAKIQKLVAAGIIKTR